MKKIRNPFKLVCIIVIALLIVILMGTLAFQSGHFDAEPVIEVYPDNCYDTTLHVITDIDYMPYSFYDSEGRGSGHDVELITMIANELHMNLDLEYLSWDPAIKAAVDGETDVLLTCDYSDTFSGVDNLLKTEPVSTDEFIVYSKSDIKSVDALYEKKSAVMKNGNVLAQIKMLNLNKRCTEYVNNREAMIALEEGNVDCAIMRYTVGEALLKELGYKDIKGTISIGESYMCFGICNDNNNLRDEIDMAIENLKTNGEMEKLNKKWLTSFVHIYTFDEVVADNIWIVFAFLLFIVGILLFFIRVEEKKILTEEEKNQYVKIVENLANDFECVNYVELFEDKYVDKTTLVRISDTFGRLFPDWSTELFFSRRLDLIMKIVVPEDKEHFYEMTRREVILPALKEYGAYFVNFRANIEGEIQYYQLKFSPIGNNRDGIRAFVCGVHNIDDEIRKELALKEELQNALDNEKKTEEMLESANKSKTDFLFNMSHDIRTPMNAITGFTNLAEKHIDNQDKVKDYLSKIKNASNHLLELINEVLDMSRVEAGKLNSELKMINIKEEAEHIFAICKETANARNIKLSLIYDGMNHENVWADELHVNRIITNVLSNSLKYTMPGGSVLYTITELESDNPDYGRYELVVEDNGIGMAADFVDKIFDSFSREETETVHEIQGTGLGMAIVKRLVDFLDGTIDIESEQGKGTKVTIVLSFKLADGVIVSDDSSMDELDIDLNGKKTLLVEDNDLNREIASELLTERGIIVDEAVNGKEAVSMVKNKGVDYYDFVLMDIQMPFMNGYDATRAIRQLPDSEKVFIIALSANAFEEDKQKSREVGMNEHISKPINVNELLRAISKAFI